MHAHHLIKPFFFGFWVWLKVIMSKEPWWANFWAAWGAILWAGWSFGDPLVLTYSEALSIPRELLPAWMWPVIGLVGGTFQLFSILTDRKNYQWWGAMFMSWWWTFLFVSIIQIVPASGGLGLYLLLMLMNYAAVWKIGR